MKKVVAPETVAHLWANESQEEARTSTGNLFFNGDTIYSYGRHFAIAKHKENAQGKKGCLFTLLTYSKSTIKHINLVSRACNHLNIIYCKSPDSYGHSENLDWWVKQCERIGIKLLSARKPEIYLQQMETVKGYTDKYCDFFGLDLSKESPKLFELLKVSDSKEFQKYQDVKEALEKKQEDERQKALKKQLKKELKEWRVFKKRTLSVRGGFDYLRYNKEENRIETSQNVQIPFESAKRFYKLIKLSLAKGGCTDCDFSILDYKVTEVNKDFIKIGCHRIATKEYTKMAEALKF